MIKKKYTTPRKMRKGERPTKALPKYFEKAHIEVMKNYDKLLATFKKMEPKAKLLRQKIKHMEQKKLQRVSKQVHTIKPAPVPQYRPDIGAFQMAYVECLQEHIQNINPNILAQFIRPMITEVSPVEIRPGWVITIYGCNFAEAPSVFFQISPDRVIQLEIQEWNSTLIIASLNSLVGYAPLRPFAGCIWIESTIRGIRKQSIAIPLRYQPWVVEYLGYWDTDLQGYGGGNHDDGTCFENLTLDDQDFSITLVTKHHSGDGHAELVEPMAGSQNMAQGWHIGVTGFGHAAMTIFYHLSGPAYVTPPLNSYINWYECPGHR